jgi:hypothetical protein
MKFSTKKQMIAKGTFLARGVGATLTIFFFFLHAEGVERRCKI